MKPGKQISSLFQVRKSFPIGKRGHLKLVQAVGCVLCLGLVGAPSRSAAPDSSAPTLGAPELFENAVQLRTQLEGKAKRLRSRQDYERVVAKYRSVYYRFPASSKADDSLLAVAQLYRTMGVDFKDARCFAQAVHAYVFLEREYPASPHASSALFAAAEIYLNDLSNLEKAGDLFRDFLKKYPASKKARSARARLDDMALECAGKSAKVGRTVKASSETEREPPDRFDSHSPLRSETSKLRLSVSTSEQHKEFDDSVPESIALVRLRDLRYWNGETYTRIVVEMESEVQYSQGRIENPPRIFIDLQKARLSSQLDGQTFEVGDGYLKRIRLGQNKPDVARIVLDVDTIQTCQISRLSSPARLVVNLRGESRNMRWMNANVLAWKAKRGEPLPDELEPKSRKVSPEGLKHDGQQAANILLPRETPSDDASHTIEGRESRAALPKSDGSRSLIRTLGLKVGRIVVDPGHGGHDTGTIGPSGLEEKELVLDVALKLKALIEARLQSEVVLTRYDDTFVPLESRTALANQTSADLFVSIHANSSRNRTVSGIETFFLNFAASADAEEIAARENAGSQKTVFELQDLVEKIALREKVDESREFAQIVQKSMASQLQKTRREAKDRGVKQAPFIVLIGANMPSILSEISFVSNPADERLLKSTSYRQKVAEALCHGIEAYAEALGGIKTAKKLP